MDLHRFGRFAMAVATILVVAACGSSSSAASIAANNAKSAADLGGMDALIAAAKAEGQLNVIALPPDWANSGVLITKLIWEMRHAVLL